MYVFHPLTVSDVRPETDDTISVAFAVPPELAADYAYAPGQHLTLRVAVDGEQLRRSYSICSGVDDGELRVAVKLLPGGRFSQWAHDQLRAGRSVDVMTPAGRFTTPLDPTAARHYLGIAAGSGITPLMSILRTVLAREPGSRFTLVYGNRGVGSIIFRDALDDLKNRYMDRLTLIHVLSRQHQDAPLFNGRIDGAKIRRLAATLLDVENVDEVFLCGPEPMTVEVRDTLLDLGVDPAHVHLELFGTPALARPPSTDLDADAHDVTVIVAGVKTELRVGSADRVLDAALRAGLDLPFSCKGGVCATCRAKVTEGSVAMALNYALEPWEVEAGFVLTCQSSPVSDRIVVDYDAS